MCENCFMNVKSFNQFTFGQRRTMSSISDHLESWIKPIVDYSSLHGLSWYNHFKSNIIKTFIFVWALAAMIGLPVLITVELRKFLFYSSILSSTEWAQEKNVSFPNLLICNPFYFNKTKMNGKT